MPRGARDAPWQPSLRTGGWWKVEAVWRVVVETDEGGRLVNNQSGRQTTALDCDCANCDCSYPLDFSGYAQAVSQAFRAQLLKARKILHHVRGGWALCATLDPIARRCGRSLVSAGRERVGEHPTDQQNERRRVIVDAGGGRASEARRFRRAGCESAQGLRVQRASSTRLLDGGARRGRRG